MNTNAIHAGNKFGLTVDEAAAYTGIGRNTLRMLIRHGKLPVLLVLCRGRKR